MSAPTSNAIEAVRRVLQLLQDGYVARDLSAVDGFLELFDDAPEMIGIGASARGGDEWFEGRGAVREIIESDWTYWGDVRIDVAGAKITVSGESAWISTTGTLTQTGTFDEAMPQYLEQMKGLLERPRENPATGIMEATYFGLSRLRERSLGVGHEWPLVITAVLVKTGSQWRFDTMHWSMPV